MIYEQNLYTNITGSRICSAMKIACFIIQFRCFPLSLVGENHGGREFRLVLEIINSHIIAVLILELYYERKMFHVYKFLATICI